MTKITIELPESHAVTTQKGAAHVTIDMTKLTPELVARLVIHGLNQKVADAAAGAKAAAGEDGDVVATAQALMGKVADSLAKGEWGVERGGAGVTAEHAEMRTILRPIVKAKFSNWKDLEEKDRVARIDAAIGKLTDDQRKKLDAKVAANLKAKAKAAEAAKALAGELGDLDI